MIPKTLPATQAATYFVHFPKSQKNNIFCGAGTGFFVSPEGHFLTSRHVITTDGTDKGPLEPHLCALAPLKEGRIGGVTVAVNGNATLLFDDVTWDIALFKLDPEFHLIKPDGNTEKIPPQFISISDRMLPEGEEVYTFGYPLSDTMLGHDKLSAQSYFSPRVTSAIIASITICAVGVFDPANEPDYLLDKPAASGNSGGPVLRTATGRVHGIIRSGLPIFEDQPELAQIIGKKVMIRCPSISRVTRLDHPSVLATLAKHGVPIVND